MMRSKVCGGINTSYSALFKQELVKLAAGLTNKLFPEPAPAFLL
jgi:hypothetical protein